MATGSTATPEAAHDAAPEHPHGILAPLSVPAFRLLLLTQLAIGLTQPLLFFTQGWYVNLAAPDGHEVVWLGLLGASRGTAFLAYVLIGGTIADRFPRRRVLLVAQSVSCMLTVAIGLVLLLPAVRDGEGAALPLMLLAFASFGLIMGQDNPTRTAMVRDSVPPALLTGAISTFQLTVSLALLVAAPFSGWSIQHLGTGPTYLLSALGPLVVVGLGTRLPRGAAAADPNAAQESVLRNLADGVRVLRDEPVVRWTVLLTWACTAAGLSVMGVIIAAWVKNVLHLDAAGWGLLALCWGIGSVIASLWFTMRPSFHHKGRMFLASCLLFGTAVLGFSLVRSLPLAFLCNTLAGLGFMSMTVTGLAIVQTTTPNRLLGRVTGLLLLGGGLMQVTGLGVGLLAGAIGIEPVYVGAGTTILLATILVGATQRPLREVD